MTQKTIVTSTKILISITIFSIILKTGYLQDGVKYTTTRITTIPQEISKSFKAKEIFKQAKKKYVGERVILDKNTKFKDLFDRIKVEIPKEEKITIQLPKVSTVIKPVTKSGTKIVKDKIKNWKNKFSNKSDQSDQEDQTNITLIEDILSECDRTNNNNEKISLKEVLDEYKNN
jgi:hypothetical protein